MQQLNALENPPMKKEGADDFIDDSANNELLMGSIKGSIELPNIQY